MMKTGFALLLAFTLLSLAGCTGEPRALRPSPDAPADAAKNVQAYVVSHGWHTGLVVPAAALNTRIPDLAERFGPTAFYEIGWGDKGFYQAQDITTGLALRALFWSPGTVIHVSAVPDSPADTFPESQVVSICVSRGQIDALNQFLSDSFLHDPTGKLRPLSKGIYGDSQFYAAVGRYSVANTCNKWTAKGLQSAGFEIDPSLKLTSGSVMSFLHEADPSCQP